MHNNNFDIQRLPLGNITFSNIRNNDKIYVDKTDLIYDIAINDIPVFISRPKCFGKTLLVNTLYSLFSNGLEDFRGLAIEKLWHDKTYHVVRINFSGFSSKSAEKFKSALNLRIIDQFNINYQNLHADKLEPSELLYAILEKLPDDNIVLLIDEYDAPFIYHLNKLDEIDDILEILSDFYSVIKEYTAKFRFIFITGVIKFLNFSFFSVFDNIVDLTFIQKYNNFLGFTHNELIQFFDPYVQNAANILNISKEDVYTGIKNYYGGFTFSHKSKETIYNPYSILHFLHNPIGSFQNYWIKSASLAPLTNNYLKANDSFDYIDYKYRNITVGNLELSANYDIKTIPTKILLYHAGYLTLRTRYGEKGLILVPPNCEIDETNLRLYLKVNDIEPDPKMIDEIYKIFNYIDSRNLPSIIRLFNDILAHAVTQNNKIFDDERSVRDIIFATLTLLDSLIKFKEQQTSTEFCDLELITKNTHMVIEFKRTYLKDQKDHNKYQSSAKAALKEAIEQIKTHQYGRRSFQTRPLYRVAMVISTEDRRILPEYSMEVSD